MSLQSEQVQDLSPNLEAKQEDRASTKMSDGSVQNEEEDLKHNKSTKYEYINEQTQDWPQWSVQEKIAPKEQEIQDTFKLMYSRSLDHALRTKLKVHLPIVAKKVRDELGFANLTEEQKKSIDMKKQINKGMKGWRNW